MTEQARCSATTRNGGPCRAFALPGKSLCVFHDPESAAAREAGRKQGGKTRCRPRTSITAQSLDLPCSTGADLVALLGQSINELRKGVIDPKVANSTAYLVGALIRAIETQQLTAQLDALKRKIDEAEQEDSECFPPPTFDDGMDDQRAGVGQFANSESVQQGTGEDRR